MIDILNVGDHVCRHPIWNDQPIRSGVVTERYRPIPSHAHTQAHQDHWWLYAVKWDDSGLTERGYMREGLELT